MSDLLTLYWQRLNQEIRTSQVKQYPLPEDGASFVVMSNFFSVVGFGDDRVITPESLSSKVWLAKPWILTKFLELWPKIKPEWQDEPSTP